MQIGMYILAYVNKIIFNGIVLFKEKKIIYKVLYLGHKIKKKT